MHNVLRLPDQHIDEAVCADNFVRRVLQNCFQRGTAVRDKMTLEFPVDAAEYLLCHLPGHDCPFFRFSRQKLPLFPDLIVRWVVPRLRLAVTLQTKSSAFTAACTSRANIPYS